MTLSDKQREYIRGVGGEEMLKRALNAEKKRDDAKMQKNNPGGIGTAHKISVDVDRLTNLYSLANSISKPKNERIAALVNDLGIDLAERALLILANESPDAPLKAYRGKSLVDMLLKGQT